MGQVQTERKRSGITSRTVKRGQQGVSSRATLEGAGERRAETQKPNEGQVPGRREG